MNAPLARALLVSIVVLAPAAAARAAGEPPEAGRRSEPHVQVTVVEDDGARIEELRVRGRTQRITVAPKGPIRQEYEILPADGVREHSPQGQGAAGAAGQRVWNVLSF